MKLCRAGAPSVVIEDVAPEAPEVVEVAKVSTVAASVAALIARNKDTDAKLQDTSAQLVALDREAPGR